MFIKTLFSQYRQFPRRCLSSSSKIPDYLQPGLATNLPSVTLSYDKFVPEASTNKTSLNSPLIILHGLFGSKSNNRTVAKQLATLLNREIYCLDLRNHGDSPHAKPHDYPSLAQDVEEFMANHDLVVKKPIIVGHSMGAKTAMAIALRRPDWLKFLVAVDNAPVSYPIGSGSRFGIYIRSLREIVHNTNPAIVSRTQADECLKKVEPSLPIRQFLLTNISRKTKSDVTKEFENNKLFFNNDVHNVPVFKSKIPLDILGKAIDRGNISDWPYDPRYSNYKGETLIIRGTESKYVADDILPAVASFFPKFEVRDVKAGHWLISENPKEFVEVLRDWIEFKEECLDDSENHKPII